MSENAPEGTTADTPQEGEPEVFDAEYVAKLRKEAAKHRTEAKANAEAARRLAEIEAANQTEAEKTAARLAAAENEVAEAKAEALRYRIAAEFKLDEKQAARLRHAKDEEAIRDLAEGLATQTSDSRKQGNHVPREGSTPPAAENDERAVARALFGST